MRLIDADRFYDDLDKLQNRKQECEVYGSLYECSACGEQVIGNTPFCPECGKLMKNGKARFF